VPRPESVASIVETLATLVAAFVVSVADSAVILMAALVDLVAGMAAHHFVATVDSADESADSVTVTAVASKYSTSTIKSARMSVTSTAATSEIISFL